MLGHLKRIFCPETTKFGPNLAFLTIAGSFGALLMGWLVVVARGLYLARHLFTLWQNWVSHLMQKNVSGLANRGYAGDLLKGIFFLLGVTFSILLIIYFNTGGCYSKWGLGEILHWRRVHYFCQVYILQSPLLSFTTTTRPFKKQTNVRVTWDLL